LRQQELPTSGSFLLPIELNQLPAAITYHDLTEGIHTIGGARVATQFLHHPAMTVGYRVEADGVAVVYLVDHEQFSDELWRAGAEPGRIESILPTAPPVRHSG
jgi:hypothetical protein